MNSFRNSDAVIAPPYFAFDEREQLAHFVAAARACAPTPFYAYEFAARSGYALAPATVQPLAPDPQGGQSRTLVFRVEVPKGGPGYRLEVRPYLGDGDVLRADLNDDGRDGDEKAGDAVYSVALAMPPGLSLVSVSQRALARAAQTPGRGYYFDFIEFEKNAKESMTPSTPSISHTYALSAKLDEFFAEGLEARYARHRQTKQHR